MKLPEGPETIQKTIANQLRKGYILINDNIPSTLLPTTKKKDNKLKI